MRDIARTTGGGAARTHLRGGAVRFMGFLIGPLPDHKRIFDVYRATRLRVSYIFFPPIQGALGERERAVLHAHVPSSSS